jgi:hypothetical protein
MQQIRKRRYFSMKNWSLKKIVLDVFLLSAGCISLAYGFTFMLRPNGLMPGEIPRIVSLLARLTEINYVIIFYSAILIILVATFMFMEISEGLKIILLSIIIPALLIFLKFCVSNSMSLA